MGRRVAAVALALAIGVVAACTGSEPTTTGGDTGISTAPAGSSGSAGTGPVDSAGPGRYANFSSPIYDDPANWMCAPGTARDFCLTEDLRTTVIGPDGSTTITDAPADPNPSFDCFYVYPTVNLAGGPGTDDAMAADSAAEQAVLRNQFSRFRTVCRPFAPLYRQITLSSFAASNRQELQDKAYGDVHDAFGTYMARWNQGRPVLLIGHSQGSGMLARLLHDDFDDDPAMRALLVSAMLVGGSTAVPIGTDVGGTFAHLPACRAATQTGCVIGFNTVPAGDTEAAQRWGAAEVARGDQPGAANLTKLCTNPANLAGGPGPLLPIVANQGTFVAGLEVATPFVELPDAFTAECVTGDGLTTLQVTTTTPPRPSPDPRDPARSRLIQPVPGWGLHISEVNLTLGNLLAIARSQGAAMR